MIRYTDSNYLLVILLTNSLKVPTKQSLAHESDYTGREICLLFHAAAKTTQ